MEEYAHKQDIINTRKGCLGGSDAKMIQNIAQLGYVPESAKKRLAVCAGLIEPEQFTNQAMEYGNFVEAQVFESLHSQDQRWQSNPCLVSKKYSQEGLKIIDHIDLYLQDDEHKVLTIGEVKATKYTFAYTRDQYIEQLAHHYRLGSEKARELGNYKLRVILAHYCTEGIDLNGEFTFDPSRLTVKPVRLAKVTYDIEKGVGIITDFLKDFNEYYTEEIDGSYLPVEVKTEFDAVATMLAEIKEREQRVEDFKKKLAAFMENKGLKKISTDNWSITYIAPTESVSFDSKRYLADYATKYPRKYKKLVSDYEKRSKRGAYVTIKTKNNND